MADQTRPDWTQPPEPAQAFSDSTLSRPRELVRADWSAPVPALHPSDIYPADEGPGEGNLAQPDEVSRPAGPARAEDFDLGNLPHFNGEDRFVIDLFAGEAAEAGLSQREFSDAVSWALRVPTDIGLDRGAEKAIKEDFMDNCIRRGWQDPQILAAVAIGRKIIDGEITKKLPSGAALNSELAKLEKLMRTDRKAYYSDGGELRYRTLLHARGGR